VTVTRKAFAVRRHGMIKWLISFASREEGAITVDWVVLTAAMIGMTLAVVIPIRSTATDPADSVGASLTAMEVE
jgi:hypothetical protein